jgi:hypothetical protein
VGRRIADGYAEAASRLDGNQRAHEFDGDSLAAHEFLSKSNEMARAFTIPGGQEALALAPALLHLQSQDSEETFGQVFQALQPVLSEILDGMWLGEWEFNDSGLVGTLKIPGCALAWSIRVDNRNSPGQVGISRHRGFLRSGMEHNNKR